MKVFTGMKIWRLGKTRRLSIIESSSGNQPISNETGDLQLMCNGEIYAYVFNHPN